MFREIIRFELRQQLRSPLLWLVAFLLAALACAATSSHSVTIGGGIGNVHRNAPTVVINMLGMFSVIGLFLIPMFVVGAVLRDFGANTAEMMFATPVGRGTYLGGRFAAGWLASVMVMFIVAIGMWLGSLMPWLDPMRLGPTPWAAYAWGIGVIVLPNLLFLSALLTLVAALTRSMLATYVGVVAFFVIRIIANLALGHGNIAHQSAAALDDPFGIAAVNLMTRYWTAADQNHRIPALTGLLVENRLIWLSIAALMLGTSLLLFKPERDGIRWFRRKRSVVGQVSDRQTVGQLRLPHVALQSGISARLTQFGAMMRLDALNVLGSTAFLVMLLFGLLNLTGFLIFSGQIFGTSTYPVTEQMAAAINDTYKWLLWIILGFYAGELIWRERAARINEVMDALPTPEWIPLFAKIAALVAVIAVFLLAASLYCAGFQLVHGFHDIQVLLYLKFLGLDLIQFGWFAAFAVVLQSLASNKFAGYALTVAYMLALIALAQLHFSDNLYLPGIAPSAPYSDINGFGTFWVGTLWFYAYWYLLVVTLLVLAALFRVRGNPDSWRARYKVATRRFGVPQRVTMVVALIGFAVVGSFIFYNTHELYRYRTHEEKLRLAADYEKAYKKYQYLPGPRITDVKLDIAMYPAQRRADVRGQYTLVNRHTHPLDELLVQLPVPSTREFKVGLRFPAHTVEIANAAQGFYLYRLAQPLAPGSSMTFQFHERVAYPGFANEPAGRQIVRNGTFFTNESFPQFCYDVDRQLTDANQRRRFGLPMAQRMPKRSDARAHANTYISCDSDWVNFSATVSTSADQIALAPGRLIKEWTAGDRRYFHYVLGAPTLNFFSFQSARYKVARSRWKNVALEVYYVGRHAYNVKRALAAMKDALAFCSKHFGPYQFRQLRIVEFPGYATYAQTFPGTIPYSHRFMLQDLRKPSDLDYVTYVTAHETSHEWWAHQAIGADVRGATMLSESLAQYSAMMVMKRLYGPLAMRKFLKYEVDQYLAGRAAERVHEEPLVRVDEQQGYIDYDKAAVILYALQDYLGEDRVDAALRTWLDKVRFQQPPYTDSHDLMSDLRAAAGPTDQNLIKDFFDRITLFQDRMRSASATKLPNGSYRVTMHVHAAEYSANGKGKETRMKLDIPIEIGVFARAKDGQEQDETPLYLAKYPVANGDSTIQVTVAGKPYQAGIDPFNELIDRVSTGKRVRVVVR